MFFLRLLLAILIFIVFMGLAWILMTGGMFLKRLGNRLLKKIGIEERTVRLPLLVFIIVFGIGVVFFIINLVQHLQDWVFQDYLLSLTPIGNVIDDILTITEYDPEGLKFWGKVVMLVYVTGVAGVATLIITILTSSLYQYLREERGMSFLPAILLAFLFSFMVSGSVSFLTRLIPTATMAKHFTGSEHGFGWALLLILLLACIAFFSIGWLGEMILQVSRFILFAMAIGYARGTLDGTRNFDLGTDEPLYWVFLIVLILFWIVRQMRIEPLEEWIESSSDNFIATRTKRSWWVPFIY